MDSRKINVHLVTKLAEFKDTLEIFFPYDETYYNIGAKCDELEKNIFLNDFLYGILGTTKNY